MFFCFYQNVIRTINIVFIGETRIGSKYRNFRWYLQSKNLDTINLNIQFHRIYSLTKIGGLSKIKTLSVLIVSMQNFAHLGGNLELRLVIIQSLLVGLLKCCESLVTTQAKSGLVQVIA